jgi:hypothetical protein
MPPTPPVWNTFPDIGGIRFDDLCIRVDEHRRKTAYGLIYHTLSELDKSDAYINASNPHVVEYSLGGNTKLILQIWDTGIPTSHSATRLVMVSCTSPIHGYMNINIEDILTSIKGNVDVRTVTFNRHHQIECNW